MNELQVAKLAFSAASRYQWAGKKPHERMRMLGMACFFLQAQERRPARTPLQMAHRLHAAYTAYCMHAMATVTAHGGLGRHARRRQWTRRHCRAWEAEPDWQRDCFLAAGLVLFEQWARAAKKASA